MIVRDDNSTTVSKFLKYNRILLHQTIPIYLRKIHFLDIYGHQNSAQMNTYCVSVFLWRTNGKIKQFDCHALPGIQLEIRHQLTP